MKVSPTGHFWRAWYIEEFFFFSPDTLSSFTRLRYTYARRPEKRYLRIESSQIHLSVTTDHFTGKHIGNTSTHIQHPTRKHIQQKRETHPTRFPLSLSHSILSCSEPTINSSSHRSNERRNRRLQLTRVDTKSRDHEILERSMHRGRRKRGSSLLRRITKFWYLPVGSVLDRPTSITRLICGLRPRRRRWYCVPTAQPTFLSSLSCYSLPTYQPPPPPTHLS